MGVTLHFEGDGTAPFSLVLDRFKDRVEHARPAFEAMGKLVAEIERKQFDTQGAHSTAAWAALSPRYAAWKQAHYGTKPILERTGALRNTLVNAPMGVWEISDRGMTVGTAIPYARYHQDGTGKMPARPIFGPFQNSEMKMFAKIMQEWIINNRVAP